MSFLKKFFVVHFSPERKCLFLKSHPAFQEQNAGTNFLVTFFEGLVDDVRQTNFSGHDAVLWDERGRQSRSFFPFWLYFRRMLWGPSVSQTKVVHALHDEFQVFDGDVVHFVDV